MRGIYLCLVLIIESFLMLSAQEECSIEQKPKKTFKYTNPITRDSDLSMRDKYNIKVDSLWNCVGNSNPIWEGPNPGVRQ